MLIPSLLADSRSSQYDYADKENIEEHLLCVICGFPLLEPLTGRFKMNSSSDPLQVHVLIRIVKAV